MKQVLIQKFSKRGKLVNLPISELPRLAEEDHSLPSWRKKPVEIIFLEQELDHLNQKINLLQEEASREVFLPSKPEPVTEVKEPPPKKVPTVIEVSEEHEIINRKLGNVDDLLDRLEQAAVETGKIVSRTPSQKKKSDLKYIRDKTLVKRLQDAVVELQGRLQELEIKGEKKYLKKETQKAVKKIIEKVSIPSESQEEKLSEVEKELNKLKERKEQKAKIIITSPDIGHESVISEQQLKKAKEEVRSIIRKINDEIEQKDDVLLNVEKKIAGIDLQERPPAKVVINPPNIVHQSFLSQQQQKKAKKEIREVIKKMNSNKENDLLLNIEKKIANLRRKEKLKAKIILAQSDYVGKSTLEKEIIDRELKKSAKIINQTKKVILQKSAKPKFKNKELQQIDKQLANLKSVRLQAGKVILFISPIQEKSMPPIEGKEKLLQELKKIKTILSKNILLRKKNRSKNEQQKKSLEPARKNEKSQQELEKIDYTLAKLKMEKEELAIAQ